MPNKEKIASPPCELCGGGMTFVHSIPKVASFPELLTFICTKCGDVRTIEKQAP